MTEKDFEELSAGHALNALSPDDERRFVAALAEDPERWEQARQDAETAAALAESVAPVAPDAAVRAALLARLSGAAAEQRAPSPAPVPAPSPAPSLRRGRVLFALAACLAVLVGIGYGTIVLRGTPDPPAAVVVLEEIAAAPDAQQASVAVSGGGTATAHWSATVGSAVLVAEGLAVLDPDQTYQLWFVRGETPLPDAVFDGRGGSATVALQQPMHEADVIAVTIEPVGGSPTGKPSGDPILVIDTA